MPEACGRTVGGGDGFVASSERFLRTNAGGEPRGNDDTRRSGSARASPCRRGAYHGAREGRLERRCADNEDSDARRDVAPRPSPRQRVDASERHPRES